MRVQGWEYRVEGPGFRIDLVSTRPLMVKVGLHAAKMGTFESSVAVMVLVSHGYDELCVKGSGVRV